MQWDEYKELCDHPSVLTRWLIEQTIRICNPKCARWLQAILETAPITKPAGHKGGEATDMFSSSLSREVVVRVVEQVQRAIATDKRTTGPIERNYSSIEKTWLEYLHWREAGDDGDCQRLIGDSS